MNKQTFRHSVRESSNCMYRTQLYQMTFEISAALPTCKLITRVVEELYTLSEGIVCWECFAKTWLCWSNIELRIIWLQPSLIQLNCTIKATELQFRKSRSFMNSEISQLSDKNINHEYIDQYTRVSYFPKITDINLVVNKSEG